MVSTCTDIEDIIDKMLIVIVAQGVMGQSATTMIKEPKTGITFAALVLPSSTVTGGLTWGYALPPNAASTDATEYLGYFVSYVLERHEYEQ